MDHPQRSPLGGRRCGRLQTCGSFSTHGCQHMQLDFGLTCTALITGLPSVSALPQMRVLVPNGCGFEIRRYPTQNVFCRESQAASGAEGMPTEEPQEQDFWGDPTHWWDNRRKKQTPCSPDFRLKIPKVSLWLINRPGSQLPTRDAGVNTPPEVASSSVTGRCAVEILAGREVSQEIRMCRTVCEDGRICDSVDSLSLLVQLGRHVDKNLFYRVLNRCIAHKDLLMGIRIHALTTESGYEGDAFLATHLIRLYAQHGRLEEAMQVFSKVCRPSTYNWATIIFAHGRLGEGAHAIRLYREMIASRTVKPDNRVYSAVLKACAATEDLVAGKAVHAQILSSPGKPDIFVLTGLITVYAKCGSLGDARRVFDGLPVRDVVVWNAMLAGYAQKGMGQEAFSLYRLMQQDGFTPPNCITYVCLLQACASVGVGALDQGEHLHAQIEERGLHNDVVLGGSLVTMYGKCGSLDDARRVFDKLAVRNVVAWTALITGYAEKGMGQEALTLYRCMQQDGCLPNSVTLVCLLQACACLGMDALEQGKQFHAQIEERGLQVDVVLGRSLVNMYVKCGSLEDARLVFDRLPERSVVVWTMMLAGYAQQGMGQEALSLYKSMQREGMTTPDSVAFVCLLQACASVGSGAVIHGQQLHAQIEERGLQDDLVVGGSLVNMYAKCSCLGDARRVFDSLLETNVVAWNAMLAGYAQQGMGEEALNLYSLMQEEGLTSPNSVTFVCLLQACASVGVEALDWGKQLHVEIEKRKLQYDVVVGGSLVNMYSKCGNLEEARSVFERLLERNVVAWTELIAGYVEQGCGQEALSLYSSMQQEGLSPPNSRTYVCLLQACAIIGAGALDQGKQLHAAIVDRELQDDAVLVGSLVNMYAKCGSLQDARKVFDKRLAERTVVTWTALIAGYTKHGMGEEALSLYKSMQHSLTMPDAVTFVCLLQACASVGVRALEQGKQLHAQIEEQGLQEDVVLGGSLVNMYAKCGSLQEACRVFDGLPERTVVTWTALLAGHVEQGMGQEALSHFNRMQQEGITIPDAVTYVCLLQACAIIASLPQGKQLHAQIEAQGLQGDLVVGAALVNMYAKCGSMSDSQQVFDSLSERNVEAWNALIGGYTRQGDIEVVFGLVDRMRLVGLQPDGITFLCVLTACSHVGEVDKGCDYFEDMMLYYGVTPTIHHYTCMVDLLGRAGHLDEALVMARTMPFPPTAAVFVMLLGSCRKWNNVEIGHQALELAANVDVRMLRHVC